MSIEETMALVALVQEGRMSAHSATWYLYACQFCDEQELTNREFDDPINQTLFAIQYPEARP